MNKKQNKPEKILGYDKSTISLFKSGKRSVSWPLAAKLFEIFPKKSIHEWKISNSRDIAQAFDILKQNKKQLSLSGTTAQCNRQSQRHGRDKGING